MTPLDHKKYFSHFLKGYQEKLHFAAHSHHFWPDVSREAHMQYWDDSARLGDEKWNYFFSHVIPDFQNHVAKMLQLKHSEQISFAPNTHELISRLLSHFIGESHLKILTTSSEFHSWRRQLLRISELPQVEVTYVSTHQLLEKRRIFIDELKHELSKKPSLFFISQVFFDSGIALTDDELLELSLACHESTIMVVDGYHGFAALPTNLSQLEGRIFYVAGGYKYAQAGEGAGFMVVPKGKWRPAYTGWFADFAKLSSSGNQLVGYSDDAMAFMGATQDLSGLYRFNAVWDLFSNIDLTVNKIHLRIHDLQLAFLNQLPTSFYKKWELTPLFNRDLKWHGHFLTFEAPSEAKASELELKIKNSGVIIDRRGARLRFGFGLYHNLEEILKLIECLRKLA
jgi:selenocysteine lyase/cysteine desulfurase